MNSFQSTGSFHKASENGGDAIRALVAKLQFHIVYGCFFELPGKLVTFRVQSRTVFAISLTASILVDIVRKHWQARMFRLRLQKIVGPNVELLDVEGNLMSEEVPLYGEKTAKETSEFRSIHETRIRTSELISEYDVGGKLPTVAEEYDLNDHYEEFKRSVFTLFGSESKSPENEDQNASKTPLFDQQFPQQKQQQQQQQQQQQSARNSDIAIEYGKSAHAPPKISNLLLIPTSVKETALLIDDGTVSISPEQNVPQLKQKTSINPPNLKRYSEDSTTEYLANTSISRKRSRTTSVNYAESLWETMRSLQNSIIKDGSADGDGVFAESDVSKLTKLNDAFDEFKKLQTQIPVQGVMHTRSIVSRVSRILYILSGCYLTVVVFLYSLVQLPQLARMQSLASGQDRQDSVSSTHPKNCHPQPLQNL
jgi:hypothetical protein